MQFRQSAEKVARGYLKAQNKKLRKGRRREHTVRNEEASREGIEDSKQIDVKRRRIEAMYPKVSDPQRELNRSGGPKLFPFGA